MAEKTLELEIGERIYLLTILNAFKGSLEHLSIVLDDVKKIALSDEEKKKINYRIEPTEEKGKSTVRWDPNTETPKSVTLNEYTLQYLLDDIKSKDEKGEFTAADVGVITLKDKLSKV